jgi:Ca2+-binding RTX toxin-like protein
MFENLESRQFLSVANPGAGLTRGHTLYVRGTDSADEIHLTVSGARVAVVLNGNELISTDVAGVRRIYVDCLGGNDRFTGAGGTRTIVAGGDGADTLTGGFGDDSIFGGAGDDVLDGSLGNDSLYGGDGADNGRPSLGSDLLDSIENFTDPGKANPRDVDAGQLFTKFVSDGGHTYVRVTAAIPVSQVRVTFGALSSSGGDFDLTVTAVVDPTLPISLRPGPFFHRTYYDLGQLTAGEHSLTLHHADGSVITTVRFVV